MPWASNNSLSQWPIVLYLFGRLHLIRCEKKSHGEATSSHWFLAESKFHQKPKHHCQGCGSRVQTFSQARFWKLQSRCFFRYPWWVWSWKEQPNIFSGTNYSEYCRLYGVTYIYIRGTQMTLVLIGISTLFWRVQPVQPPKKRAPMETWRSWDPKEAAFPEVSHWMKRCQCLLTTTWSWFWSYKKWMLPGIFQIFLKTVSQVQFFCENKEHCII